MARAELTVKVADLERVKQLDARRQHQIANQVDIINRLMVGDTYGEIEQELVEKLSAAEADRTALEARVRQLEAALGPKRLKEL